MNGSKVQLVKLGRDYLDPDCLAGSETLAFSRHLDHMEESSQSEAEWEQIFLSRHPASRKSARHWSHFEMEVTPCVYNVTWLTGTPKDFSPPLVYRSSCKMEDTCFWSVTNSVNWLVLQTEFDPFGPVTFGKSSRAARLHFLNLSLSHWRAQPDVSHSCAQFMGPTMPTILAVELFWFHAQLSSFTRKEHGFQEREKKIQILNSSLSSEYAAYVPSQMKSL